MRIVFAFLAMPALLAAAPYEIILKKAETAALEASSTLKASGLELQAAEEKGDAGLSLLFPRIALDAQGGYKTEVPEFKLNPNAPAQRFGDNESYSLGIGATWTFWDSGNAYNLYQALKAHTAGHRAEFAAKQREVQLKARLVYFQTQLMAERARLLADSLRLAQSQAKDIELRLHAGASSRIDFLSSKNEVLRRRGDYRQARADLAGALRDLFALTGLGADLDPSVPQEASAEEQVPADTEPATLSLRLQSLAASLEELQKAESAEFSASLPQILAMSATVESAKRQAAALGSGHWPKLQAGARASFDYPNGPVLEQIQQNSFTVSASWPVFSFGQVSSQVAEQEALAEAQASRLKALTTDLRRDWNKSRDRLKALKDQKALDEQSVTETDSLYKLIYNSYQNGSSSLLEAQTASLKALESKVRLASTEAQMLIELAVQSSLSE